MTKPILYSFRRCPYAMRARLAIASSGVQVELREILLRDKAPEFLAASPNATVPVIVTDQIIEESYDIMLWALTQNDPENWLQIPPEAQALIDRTEADFKTHLDHYKYASRHPDIDVQDALTAASTYLTQIEALLTDTYLFGPKPNLADMAILPFVRQFANVDRSWFDAQPWPRIQRWLDAFLTSARFLNIMQKYPKWQAGDPPTFFP